jgi:hypothetical protein
VADNKGKIRTRKELEDKIKEIFGIETISLLISKQITTYVTEHKYTYLEIGRALFYFYEIQGNDTGKSKGIGIVPYVMEESRKYFRELERQAVLKAQEAQKLKEQEQNIIICTAPQKRRPKNRMINIESIKEADDE